MSNMWVFVCMSVATLAILINGTTRDPLDRPNIIMFVADDMGYGDLSVYGHPSQEFGRIDVMAMEGLRFMQWYSPDTMCSPSRAAMLTGRLAVRSGVYGPLRVFAPGSATGLPKNEITLPEALKTKGYVTGMAGKWHLGINEFTHSDGNHLPLHHGFDHVGTIFPWTHVPACDMYKIVTNQASTAACFLYYNTTIIQQPYSPVNITNALVLDTKTFIHDHKNQPFMYYMSFPQMHDSMFCASRFFHSSKRGRYGDMLNEMSWAVGEVLDTIRKVGIERNTLAFFISDHGPHLELCLDGGSPGHFSGGKITSWEGGHRVPGIAWWPGVIKPGTDSSHIINSMDLFNTALDLANISVPNDRIIDGLSFKNILLGSPLSSSVRNTILFYCSDRLMAIRHKDFKLHFHTSRRLSKQDFSQLCRNGFSVFRGYPCNDCSGPCYRPHMPILYNVMQDPGEQYPLSLAKYDSVIDKIMKIKRSHQAKLVKGESLLHDSITSLIPCCNPPYCRCNYTAPEPFPWDVL